jgi:hypothetical protein
MVHLQLRQPTLAPISGASPEAVAGMTAVTCSEESEHLYKYFG